MRLLQGVTLALILLIVTPGWLFYFDVTPKVVILLLVTAAVLVFRKRREISRVFTLLILLNLVSLAVSTAFSVRPGLSWIGTNWREFGLIPQAAVLIFAWSVAESPGNALPLLRAIAVSGAVAAAYGVAQYFGFDPILPSAAYHIGEGIWSIVRPPGTLGYVSYFATWLLVTLYLCLALAAMETSTVSRRAARAAAALCGLAMVLTGTRAALLGLAAGAAVWLYLRGFRVTRRMLAGGAAVLLVGAGFYFTAAGWNLRSRTRWFTEDASGGRRLTLWRDSLGMASHRLALGYGPETFTAEFARAESAELAAVYPDFEYESTHNMFLDALTSQGLPGLAAILGLCCFGILAAFRARTGESAFLAAALTAGLVSQQFTGLTIPTAALIYTTIAICATYDKKTGAWRQTPWSRGAAALVAAAMLYCAVRLTVSDGALAAAQRAIGRGDETAAASHYALYQRWRLPGASADVWYSRASLQLAQNTAQPAVRLQALLQAQAAAWRATNSASDPFDAWYNLAAFDSLRDDRAAVERELLKAVTARPTWFKPHWALARLYALESRHQEASREAALAIALDGGKDSEVTSSLAKVQAGSQE